tara:strand:+ start:187 stop:486 length:300 start_codon:yes stop_codon:yes gene_type:complete
MSFHKSCFEQAKRCELMLECETEDKNGKVTTYSWQTTGAHAKKTITYKHKDGGWREFTYDTCMTCLDHITSLEETGELEIIQIKNLKTGEIEYPATLLK